MSSTHNIEPDFDRFVGASDDYLESQAAVLEEELEVIDSIRQSRRDRDQN